MALAPDSLFDMAKVIVARAATASSCRKHRERFPFRELPRVEDLAPPSFWPPEPLEPAQNGYVVAVRIAESIPSESPTESNAVHRAVSLVRCQSEHEVAAGQKALIGYDEPLDALIEVLDSYPRWQAPTPGEHCELPELGGFTRLGQALLLRGTLRFCAKDELGAKNDFGHALQLADRLRNCEGFLLHLMVGVALEGVAQKILRQMLRKPDSWEFATKCLANLRLEGRKAELVEIFRSEFSRVCIPRALHYARPWKPAPEGSPAWFEIPILAAQLALVNHPQPYNPVETAMEITSMGEMFLALIEEGWSTAPAIEGMRQNYARGWPPTVAVSCISRSRITFSSLVQARKPLLEIENPFGRLVCARTLHSAGEVYRAALTGQLRVGQTLVLAAAVRLGRRPSCIEELVGNGHLCKVPLDPFTDEPIKYEPSDGAAWSPGPAGFAYSEAKKCACVRYDSPYWLRL